ncbi:MAG: glycosyltransferase [Deltaproteobacteria bacterium]|jgi:glycosyltransferase involved in cell wall biosynthesis|nr:glycosyltransferase [Deltaproteobacteria bacterium]
MRLAFCNSTRRWGGVKTWTIEFAAALRSRGHELFLYGRDPLFLSRARDKDLRAVGLNFGPDFNPFSIAFFLRAFRQNGIEAVLVNVGKELRSAGSAARLLGLPLVQRVGLPGDLENSFSPRLAHRLLRPRYLCPCRHVRDGLLERLPFLDPEDVSVVYSAKEPLAQPPASLGTPLRILSSSQVKANKGHAGVARVLAALRDKGFNFRWDVAGTGAALEDLRALCVALGLESRVVFHGFLADLAPLLRACDVFVLSSRQDQEGLPNALLEAMAHGLVPVAHSVGGVSECWPPALSALLVAPSSASAEASGPPEELALFVPLRKVFSAAPEEILQWKRLAWEHCSRNFSLAAQAQKLEAFFADLLRKAPKDAPSSLGSA